MKKTLRPLPALLACGLSMLIAALGGCGSSDGGDPVPTPPAATPADFWVTGISNSGTGPDTLLVIDPDQPASPRLSVSVDDYLPSIAFSYDVASSTITYLPESAVYFVRNHQLFQVSLRKSRSTVAQRISSLDTACRIIDRHSLKFDGSDDAWLEVLEAGADGDCGQATDNRHVFVRTGTPPDIAATTLPAGVVLIDLLPQLGSTDSSAFLMGDSRGAEPKLTLYSGELVPIGDVAGGAGLSSVDALPGFPALQGAAYSGYVRNGTSLHRLTWTSTGASLTPSLYTFENTPLADDRSLDSLARPSAAYFLDGLKVKRIDTAGVVSELASLDPAAGDLLTLQSATASHLVLAQSSTAGDLATTLLALPVEGGSPGILASSTAASVGGLALADGYLVHEADATASQLFTLRRIDPDGNDRLIARGNGYPMWRYKRTLDASSSFPWTPTAISWCEKADSEVDCRKGAFKSHDLSTGFTTMLGHFSHKSPAWFVQGSFFGEPMVVQAYAYDQDIVAWRKDVYLARPGHTGSLTRVTHNIP